ncbi:MAG: transcriptional regulator [Thaumarchaeota archaeon]|nr:transcriptional regulator [Nitrososphaerota archaeon]
MVQTAGRRLLRHVPKTNQNRKTKEVNTWYLPEPGKLVKATSERLNVLEKAHLRSPRKYTPREEDYVEVILELIEDKGYARAVDISNNLNVRAPTVTTMIQKLHNNGLLTYEKHRGFALTEMGEELARSVRNRHSTIAEFLLILGLDQKLAHEDAEGMEHSLQPKTLEKLGHFVRFLRANQDILKRIRESG